jgi:hypothetical protein
MLLLAELQGALSKFGVRCILARNHQLVLRYNHSPSDPSGLTDPTLYIFAHDGLCTAATDGTNYHLDSGLELPVIDPDTAAAAICRVERAIGRA